jgi:hypothetical protein
MSGLNITQTASPKTPVYKTGSSVLTHEQFPNLIRDAINEQIDEMFEMFSASVDAMQLKNLFVEKTQKGMIHRVQTKVRPNGTTPLSRDADDDIDMITASEGFGYTFRTYMYRQGVSWERMLVELDDVGAIAEKFSWLTDNADRTIKHALADVLNRGIKPTNAPVLCLDGMYLVDADRPNPDPRAPKWSNEEPDADITEDALFAAKLNAHNTVGPNGELLRLKIKKILIPQAYELVAWKLANSQKEVGNANNTANWASGNFNFEVLDDLTTHSIYYLLDDTKSDKNGLQMRWRVRPSLADMHFGTNPDKEGKRIRFGFGLGCLDPRYVWRGGLLNAL